MRIWAGALALATAAFALSNGAAEAANCVSPVTGTCTSKTTLNSAGLTVQSTGTINYSATSDPAINWTGGTSTITNSGNIEQTGAGSNVGRLPAA